MPEETEMYCSVVPREERIREYANMLWKWRSENNIAGDADGDWLQAEAEIDKMPPPPSTSRPST